MNAINARKVKDLVHMLSKEADECIDVMYNPLRTKQEREIVITQEYIGFVIFAMLIWGMITIMFIPEADDVTYFYSYLSLFVETEVGLFLCIAWMYFFRFYLWRPKTLRELDKKLIEITARYPKEDIAQAIEFFQECGEKNLGDIIRRAAQKSARP